MLEYGPGSVSAVKQVLLDAEAARLVQAAWRAWRQRGEGRRFHAGFPSFLHADGVVKAALHAAAVASAAAAPKGWRVSRMAGRVSARILRICGRPPEGDEVRV
jgi:hypothetical protein